METLVISKLKLGLQWSSKVVVFLHRKFWFRLSVVRDQTGLARQLLSGGAALTALFC